MFDHYLRGTDKTAEDVALARRFGQDFFDGERRHGYGGFRYDPKYWSGVVQDFISHYRLTSGSKVLDVGCGKGCLLFDLKKALPGISVEGIDLSSYAIQNALEEVKPFVSVGNAKDLSRYQEKEFDLVVSINTVHNLFLKECKEALQEIERVGKKAFVVLDAWRNEEEKQRLLDWNLTGVTFMHVEDWKKLFAEIGYRGDYYWFLAE